MKAPNMQSLKLAVMKNEWGLSKNAAKKLSEVISDKRTIVFFLSINKSNIY